MKFAVLVSGCGTNLQALIGALNKKRIAAEIGLVVCDRRKARALTRAKKAGIPSAFIDPARYPKREDFDREMVRLLRDAQIDFVVMAGFMRILSPYFIRTYRGRVLNIHPALLPAFKGGQAVADAFHYGVKVTGVTVHIADDRVDHGPIVLQEHVDVTAKDTLASLEKKIHAVEHRLYPKAVDLMARGSLKIEGRKVKILKK